MLKYYLYGFMYGFLIVTVPVGLIFLAEKENAK